MARRAIGRAKRVLVATDGSRGGVAALRFAVRFASCPHTALTVITVAVKAGRGELDEDRRARAALSSAAATLRRLGVSGDLRVVATRPHESVPEAIARESERLKVDLVIVGSEGRDTLREWVVGGVALRLIYLATRAVAVVRPRRSRRKE